jgi:hypothetical protein
MHRKIVVKSDSKHIWIESITFLICAITQVLFAKEAIGSGKLALTDMVNFITVIFGIAGPITMLTLPGENKMLSFFSVCMSIPFTAIGAILHAFNTIEAPLCLYYFLIPGVIGLIALLSVDKWAREAKEEEIC